MGGLSYALVKSTYIAKLACYEPDAFQLLKFAHPVSEMEWVLASQTVHQPRLATSRSWKLHLLPAYL